jgi:3-keto-5-aminohexanoate cleavage enzyme
MARRIAAHGAVPEVEIYDAGHLDIAADLLKQGLIKAPVHLQFVLGVRGAMAAGERTLEMMLERAEQLFGDGTSWGVAGIGRHQLGMAQLAAMWGGNARVGLEDNVYLDKGVLAEGSSPLVQRAVELCQRHGRAVATVSEARRMLGLNGG